MHRFPTAQPHFWAAAIISHLISQEFDCVVVRLQVQSAQVLLVMRRMGAELIARSAEHYLGSGVRDRTADVGVMKTIQPLHTMLPKNKRSSSAEKQVYHRDAIAEDEDWHCF